MARSFDRRRFPEGPVYGPDGKLIMRGVGRKLVGRVTPGDDVEVSREIERLWEWHTRLLAENNRLKKIIEKLLQGFSGPWIEAEDGSGVGSPRLTAGQADTGSCTTSGSGTSANFTNQGEVNVGPYRDNYESGYRLMVAVKGLTCSNIDLITATVEAGSESLPLPTWSGGGFSGTYNGPWTTFDATGSSMEYGEDAQIILSASTNLGLSDGTATGGTIYWRWVDADDPLVNAPFTIPYGTATNDSIQWNNTTQAWEATSELNANARIGARLNTGASTYERRRINFIDGLGMDMIVADDSVNEEIDVTVAVDPTELTITSFGGFGGTGLLFLADDGVFRAAGGRYNGVLYGTPALGTTRFLVTPRGTGDIDATFDLERLHLRTETPSSSGSVVAILQKATAGGALTWTDIGTITLTASSYEQDMTIGAYTVTSDDLLRLYFTGIGTGVTDYQAVITGTRTA